MFIVWTLVTTEMNNVNKYKGRKKNKSLFTKFQLFILLNIVYDHLSIKELITMSFYHSNLIYKLNSRLINKDFHSFFHLLRIKKKPIVILLSLLSAWKGDKLKDIRRKRKLLLTILFFLLNLMKFVIWIDWMNKCV